MSCHACKKAMLQSKIIQFYYPRLEDSLQPMHVIDVLKNHLKSLRCTSGKLTGAWITSISYDSSLGSRYGCRLLPTSMWSDFCLLLLVLHLLQESICRYTFLWLLLKRKNDIFIIMNINDNKKCLHGSKDLR